MKKEYLPSKQFVARILLLILLLAVVFGIYEVVSFFRNRNPSLLRKPVKLQIKDVVQKDTNINGIPDWEETLWGLDPNTNGPSNKEFILAKREILAKTEGGSQIAINAEPATENELLSREFFAILMSLEQSGNLDDTALKAISDTIGEKIVATSIPDTYTRNMLIIKGDSEKEIDNYFDAIKNLLLKYKKKDIGNELTFIAQGVKNNDSKVLEIAKAIGQAYKSSGKDLIKIPVPASFISIHLNLANDYDKTGQSIEGMLGVLTDQIAGMKALINYNKYSDALVTDMEILSDNY